MSQKKTILVKSHPAKLELDPELDNVEEIHNKYIREEYLSNMIDATVTTQRNKDPPVLNISAIDTSNYETDQTGHPTIEGTAQILNDINEKSNIEPGLIWNTNYITSEFMYRNVQSIYKYGCNSCEGYGTQITHHKRMNPNVCDACVQDMEGRSAQKQFPIYDEIKEKHMEIWKKVTEAVGRPKRDRESDEEEDTRKRSTADDNVSNASTDNTFTTAESVNGEDGDANLVDMETA